MTATINRSSSPATLGTWEYEALDGNGKRSKGKLDATSESAAAAMLRGQSLTPLFIGEAGKGLQREISLPGLNSRTTLKDLAIFARQFATMTASGLSLLRSLTILEEQTLKPPLAKAI